MKDKSRKLKIFIIAGEVSGDTLGAELISAANSRFNFVGVGGKKMTMAGLSSIFPISDLSVMGLVEVIMKMRTLSRRIRQTVDAIIRENPDIILTIDAPSFAARVIKKVKNNSTKKFRFYHVVAPQVWAWGASRAKKYAELFDKLFCFFDFEKPYFTKYGLNTTVIGYPFYDVVAREIKRMTKKYVTITPGSRLGETKRLMPVLKDFAEDHPEFDFAIPVTETTSDFVKREVKTWKIPVRIFSFEERFKLYNQTTFAIIKSGTTVAEMAIMHIPTVVVYRANLITSVLAKFLLRIKYVTLPNILANKEIFPELLGRYATARNISGAISKWDTKKVISELVKIDGLWHKKENSMKIVVDVIAKKSAN